MTSHTVALRHTLPEPSTLNSKMHRFKGQPYGGGLDRSSEITSHGVEELTCVEGTADVGRLVGTNVSVDATGSTRPRRTRTVCIEKKKKKKKKKFCANAQTATAFRTREEEARRTAEDATAIEQGGN